MNQTIYSQIKNNNLMNKKPIKINKPATNQDLNGQKEKCIHIDFN